MLPLVRDMLQTLDKSVEELRERIENVRYASSGISFSFDGRFFTSDLRGRNAELILGFGADADRSIALRTILDGHAKEEA